MLVATKGNDVVDVTGDNYHVYWKAQTPYNNTVFIMESDFAFGWHGYAIKYRPRLDAFPATAFFWRETVEKYGERNCKVEGKFNGKPFIRISLEHDDGR